MPRIRLTVRYDGTDFAGSQVQPGKRTVAGTLTTGLESLLGQPVKLVFASRTDAGVHANGNLCAFDAELPFPASKLLTLLERKLPRDLVVVESAAVSDDFHPRFDAVGRLYRYCVATDDNIHVDRMRFVARCPCVPDLEAVEAALHAFRGRHSFAAYSASGLSIDNSVCDVIVADLRWSESELHFWFGANRFLRHMVVRMVGALMKVAYGILEPEDIARSLETGTRDFQFRPAPAKGLILESVQYKV